MERKREAAARPAYCANAQSGRGVPRIARMRKAGAEARKTRWLRVRWMRPESGVFRRRVRIRGRSDEYYR